MQINIDCLKDVLAFCINNIDYKQEYDSWNTRYVDLNMLYSDEKLKKEYEKKDIMRSVLKLEECRFIKISTKYPVDKPYIDNCSIEDITMHGYQFYESIQDPSIWEKTKSIVGKVGNHTLGFIESVAHDIAVEAAKEAVKIAAWKNINT